MGKTLVVIISFVLFTNSPVWAQDALYFYNLGIESSMAKRKVFYFSKALELNPRLAVGYEQRGLLYYFQGKYTKMVKDFKILTELEPHEPEGHLMLGLAYTKKASYDKGVAGFTRAIELDPQLARAYNHRAEAYRLMGEHEKAIKDSTRAIELGDTEHANARAHETRARAYSELGKNALAHADLNEAYRLDPSFFFYLHPSSTDSYAQFVSNSSFASKNGIRWLGLVGILALLFVVVFKLALPSPNKTDHNEW